MAWIWTCYDISSRYEFYQTIKPYSDWEANKELEFFYQRKDLVIHMTSHEVSTDFTAFTALRSLGFDKPRGIPRTSLIYNIITEEKIGGARTYISLDLNISVSITLDMSRIDIKVFLKLSFDFSNSHKTRILFYLIYHYGLKVLKEEASIRLLKLHKSMFLLLSNTLQFFAVHAETFRNDIPSLWIMDVVQSSGHNFRPQKSLVSSLLSTPIENLPRTKSTTWVVAWQPIDGVLCWKNYQLSKTAL
jgi:hypothetical protein